MASSTLLIACAVRGDVVHARHSEGRTALCGEENVLPERDHFNADSVYACRRCLKFVRLLTTDEQS